MSKTKDELSWCDSCKSMQEHVETYVQSPITGEDQVVKYCPKCYVLALADSQTVAITHIPQGS